MKTKINLTEDINKVKNSIKNIIPEKITINTTDKEILIESDVTLLDNIHKLVKTNKLEEVTVNILNKNKTEGRVLFYVNKQAAFHNKFHIIDENMSPLDDIEVLIETSNPDSIIKWITS
ncbi:RNA-binding domain-containing protein [uncultured Methanosphaera sp.]|uniref:RNA-binding domain-containing protein n=1 Tax=uncultured Methanosphaera sp. TaxID=262501 RepID=UPI0025953F4C|nr:RNA-binding domain-containing protein [uncultured Methanosphaera sp.]